MNVSNSVCENTAKLTTDQLKKIIVRLRKERRILKENVIGLEAMIIEKNRRVDRYKAQNAAICHPLLLKQAKLEIEYRDSLMEIRIPATDFMESEIMCVICYDRVKVRDSFTMTGCGHSGICSICAAAMQNMHTKTCPLCHTAGTLINLNFEFI